MSQQKGFTLLEMLVALAVASLLLGAVAGIGVRITGNIQKGREDVQEIQSIYATLDMLEKDLSTYHHDFKGLSPWGFHFIKLEEDMGADRSGYQTVAYEATPLAKQAHLHRTVGDELVDVENHKAHIMTASKITFSYLNDRQQKLPAWTSGSSQKGPLAVAVEITDKKGNSWQRLIPLMVRTP